MNYLFVGQDIAAKDIKLTELKKQLFTSPDAASFDYEALDASCLEQQALKKALAALPVIAQQRLIVIREPQKLTAADKQTLVEFISAGSPHCTLVLDAEKWDLRGGFVKEMGRHLKIISFETKKGLDAFKLADTIAAHQKLEALRILNVLLAEGNHPLQILGALIWYWGKYRQRFSAERFKKDLLRLEQADLNIKRSRMKPEHAVELLVVQLCSA